MSHDPLEQLRVELSVEPSPEFAAKVRARIAREPKRRWTTMVVWSLAATAVVVVAVVVSLPGRSRPAVVARVEAPSAPVAQAEPAPPREAASAPLAPAAARPVAVAAVRGVVVRPAEARATRLEVLVPADQRQAIDRLIRDLNGGRLDPAALAFTSVDQQAELPKPAAIAVAPIEIPAIPGLDIKK